MNEKEIAKKTQENLCQIYKVLFDVCKQQKQEAGGEDEILEYTKSKYTIELPEPNVVLPREKPVPKAKQLTKWEKFRQEKGILEKGKRSRMVFDPISNDWVPRFGMGSIKKIQEAHNWLQPEKPKHVEAGMNPFDFKKNEKKIEKEK
jgi:hypothetical protein